MMADTASDPFTRADARYVEARRLSAHDGAPLTVTGRRWKPLDMLGACLVLLAAIFVVGAVVDHQLSTGPSYAEAQHGL